MESSIVEGDLPASEVTTSDSNSPGVTVPTRYTRLVTSSALPKLLQTLPTPSILALRLASVATCTAIDTHLFRHTTLHGVGIEGGRTNDHFFFLSSPLGLPLPGFRPPNSARGQFAYSALDDYHWRGHPRRRVLMGYTKIADWHATVIGRPDAPELQAAYQHLHLSRSCPAPNHIVQNLRHVTLRMHSPMVPSSLNLSNPEPSVGSLVIRMESQPQVHTRKAQPLLLSIPPKIVLTAVYTMIDGQPAGRFRLPTIDLGGRSSEVVVFHLVPSLEPVTQELRDRLTVLPVFASEEEGGGRALPQPAREPPPPSVSKSLFAKLVEIQGFECTKRVIVVGFAQAHAFLGYESPDGVAAKFKAFNDKIDSGEYHGCRFEVLTKDEYIVMEGVGSETYGLEVGGWEAGDLAGRWMRGS